MSVSHSFCLFFQGQFDFIFWLEFNKSLATQSAFSAVDEMNTLILTLNFAVRNKQKCCTGRRTRQGQALDLPQQSISAFRQTDPSHNLSVAERNPTPIFSCNILFIFSILASYTSPGTIQSNSTIYSRVLSQFFSFMASGY